MLDMSPLFGDIEKVIDPFRPSHPPYGVFFSSSDFLSLLITLDK